MERCRGTGGGCVCNVGRRERERRERSSGDAVQPVDGVSRAVLTNCWTA